VDNNRSKIERLNADVMPIYEHGLEALVQSDRQRQSLSFTTDLRAAADGADAVFIAVGTPSRASDGKADLSFVYAAARDIIDKVDHRVVIVIKSTVPVGTGDIVERLVAKAGRTSEICVVSNPEFLREGSAIEDFQNPDRVVVGTETGWAQQVMLDLYANVVARSIPVVVTQRRTAELIKYGANSFLATKITYINEMADLYEKLGANVVDLSLAVGLDHRIGGTFLNAGPGYGGSCFPKDTVALLRTAQDVGVSLRIIEEAVSVNNARKRRMALKVIEALGGDVDGATIAVLGLSFKPDTDDMRDAAAIPLIAALEKAGATVRAYDPVAMGQAGRLMDTVTLFEDPYACATGADAVVIVTDWAEFKSMDLERLRGVMSGDVLVDLRNIIDPAQAESAGYELTSIGRGARQQRVDTPAEPINYPSKSIAALAGHVEGFQIESGK
jgi:UDPglucose 6-dehydrogenase